MPQGGARGQNLGHLKKHFFFCFYFYLRPEFFYFSFYRPSRPNFLEIEKKIKEISINFIFLFPSDSCQYSTGVQLCFFVLSFLLLPG